MLNKCRDPQAIETLTVKHEPSPFSTIERFHTRSFDAAAFKLRICKRPYPALEKYFGSPVGVSLRFYKGLVQLT